MRIQACHLKERFQQLSLLDNLRLFYSLVKNVSKADWAVIKYEIISFYFT